MIKTKKKVSMYFKGMEERYGKDWITKVSPVEILRKADSFFKDLAYGGIDKTLYGYAFDNFIFMSTMINESYHRYEMEFMEVHALETYGQVYPMRTNESLYMYILTQHKNNADAYSYINICLHQMMSISGNEKLARLDLIANHLSSLRHSL
jgi:hypothetical protein